MNAALKESDMTYAQDIVHGAIQSQKCQITEADNAKNQSTMNIDKFISHSAKLHDNPKDQLPNLMVFVSFSMPQNSMQQLSYQVMKAGGVLVFRGMHQGSLKKTVNLMQSLSEKGVSAIIHPKLFTQFHVSQMPTFILLSDTKQTTDKLAGNVPLEFALRSFADSGDNKKLAENYLKKMEVSK
jgi:type-F conjugative transfer system pilin assembly protein TrbC